MKFYLLARGAQFEFRGRRFVKTAMAMARDQDGIGNIFQGGMEVTPIGELQLLSDAEDARWKPSDVHWTSFITPAPGES
jgi:hypothetical protein